MHPIFYNKYLIFLLSFFSPMVISIGGEVSPSFIFILVTFIFWSKGLDFKRNSVLKKFSKLFYVIIALQFIWIPFSTTDVLTQIKGILVTFSGLLFFWYYFVVYINNRDVVKWGVLGTFLSTFLFINVLSEISGGNFGFWKFQVFPRLVSLCTLLYLWTCNNSKFLKISPYLFMGIGLLGLTTGARSMGLIPLIAGSITWFILRGRNKMNLKKIKRNVFVGAVLLYSVYALVYVPEVLDGSINSGNSAQLKKIENPYNPLNLLLIGRADSVVPFLAFFDRPLTGWGYYTKDPDLKYHNMLINIKDGSEQEIRLFDDALCIPGHSVWGYYSCSYGIIAFIAFGLMIYLCWKYDYLSWIARDKYLLYRIFVLVSFSWNILFSPMAHFKTLPSTIAAILVFSIMALKEKKT